MTNTPHAEHTHRRLTTINWVVFAGFAAVALYFLLTKHAPHVYVVLPFLLVAACPLMHVFHHHGHHEHTPREDRDPAGRPTPPPDHSSEPR